MLIPDFRYYELGVSCLLTLHRLLSIPTVTKQCIIYLRANVSPIGAATSCYTEKGNVRDEISNYFTCPTEYSGGHFGAATPWDRQAV